MPTSRTRYPRRISMVLSTFASAIALIGLLALFERAEAAAIR